MNPGLDYYRDAGLQAWGTITFTQAPPVGHAITVAGTAFTAGTDYRATTAAEAAEALSAAINGDRARYGYLSTQLRPSRSFFAYFAGRVVVVVASLPGTAGNAITLATSDATVAAVSGATLADGEDGPATAGGGLPASALLTARTVTAAVVTVAATGVAQALAATATKFSKLHLLPASGNAATIMLGTATVRPLPLSAGGWFAFDPPPGAVGDLATLYITGTAGDTVSLAYWN